MPLTNLYPAWARGLAAALMAAAGAPARGHSSPDPPALARVSAPVPAGPSIRQQKLERFRAVQAEIRTLKKQARMARRFRLETEAGARQRAFRAWRGLVDARREEREARAGPRRRNLVLVAGGVALFLGSPYRQAWAQSANVSDLGPAPASGPVPSLGPAPGPGTLAWPDPAWDLASFTATRTAFAQAGTLCAGPLLDLSGLFVCAPEFQTTVLARIDDLEARTPDLFVPPETLGAGGCRAGGDAGKARERIKLFQASQALQYDRYAADALTLRYQFLAVGRGFRALGLGLRTGQALALPRSLVPAVAAVVPALVFAELDDSLSLAGFTLAGAGNTFGVLAAEALAHQAAYLAWAQGQTEALPACSGAGASLPPSPATAPPPSPLPILADLLDWAQRCPAAVAMVGIDASTCGGPLAARLQAGNGTLAGLVQQVACLGAAEAPGCLPSRREGPGLYGAILLLKQYGAQLDAARYMGQALADGIFGAGEILRIEAEPLVAAGDAQGAAGLAAGRDLLFAFGAAVTSDAYFLDSIGAGARSLAAALGLEANAERWARLDQDPPPAPGTGTGHPGACATPNAQAGAMDSSGDPGPSPAGSTAAEPHAPAAWEIPGSPGSSTAPMESGALRARPFLPWVLVLASAASPKFIE